MKQYTCSKCQNQMQIEEDTKFVSCTKCFSYHEVESTHLAFISTFPFSNSPKDICFDIEQKILINDTEYTIKGLVQRNDFDYKAINWREYFLKNTLGEYAFLNEYNGNWILVKSLGDNKISVDNLLVYFETENYSLFQKYYQEVNWAAGGFDFDITDTNKLYSREYIAPPKILINEVRKQHATETDSAWYLGEYLNEKEVYSQINEKNIAKFPTKKGVGATEPYQAKFYYPEALRYSLVALAMLLVLQIGFLFYSPTKQVLSESFTTSDLKYDSVSTYAVSPKPIISKSFEIERTSKIEIELVTDVDNSWLESNITMVNEKTGEELPIVLGAEYYHGIEGGESWTEGDRRVAKDYSSVPAGKYHLLVETSTPKKDTGSYSIRLSSGGMYFMNLLVMVLLLAIMPIYLYLQQRDFEKKRWADSDFSPYISDEA